MAHLSSAKMEAHVPGGMVNQSSMEFSWPLGFLEIIKFPAKFPFKKVVRWNQQRSSLNSQSLNVIIVQLFNRMAGTPSVDVKVSCSVSFRRLTRDDRTRCTYFLGTVNYRLYAERQTSPNK